MTGAGTGGGGRGRGGRGGVAPPRRVGVRVPAKINLFLSVRGRRPDGYHEVVTVLETVALHDVVTAELIGDRGECQHPSARARMGLHCSHDAETDLPTDQRNLAVRAAHTLADAMGIQLSMLDDPPGPPAGPTTALHLDKAIPLSGGMAGGSADAAGALLALDRLWGCGLVRAELEELAVELGADVPFCLSGGTALATGTGTATAQILSTGTYEWVLVLPEDGLGAAEVYDVWDRVSGPSEAAPDAVLEALRTQDAVALGAALHNELEDAVFELRPELRDVRDALLEAGALGAMVSGSGPTVAGLARDPFSAARITAELQERGLAAVAVRGPAGGPEVVAIG